MAKYRRFLVMVLVSTVVMFCLMYFNTYELDQVYFSQTRAFMALMMGAVMAILMLGFMWKMYDNKRLNYLLLIVSGVIFLGSLFMVRSQTGVNDKRWMGAMIPHHSIAILTSKRAHLTDPRVKKLAKNIVVTQEREIKEMKKLIAADVR